jgi:hypothetical protein
MHVHHAELWKKLLQANPSTNKYIEYGTPQMAFEIQRLLKNTNLAQIKLFAMGGHEDGIISFGTTIEQTGILLTGALNVL